MDTLGRTRPRHATIKVRNFLAVPAVVEALGADPDAVARSAGLDPAIFADPALDVPYAALGRLVRACVAATGCDTFGLMVGARQGATAPGLTGLMALNAPTVGEGLRVLAEGLKTSDTGGVVLLGCSGGEAWVGYHVIAPAIDEADQIVDAGAAIAFNILRAMRGLEWRPLRVRLTCKPPRDRTPYARLFGAPVEFGAASARVVFDAALLDAPILGRDPDTAAILAPLYAEALAAATADFVSAARALVRAQLGAASLSRESVARALGVSERTLVHRLEARGLTYSGLADEAKFETAQSLLRKGETIADTAARLGFADQSAFTRAFKAWSGAPPARWRTERGEG
ncbi:AraC-like DNA-binding protein [Roseiarcus fermentans]|uniref:AraC-like DNA-binding protein n=1 Tax=Roseiarcus fermentans TaxID=1473586 RepID=A0A366FSN8_9HYPH|nr:AraC family transcriptional regulator [Roseiarcus fermentans]RBP17693.1 AraC-like DNA-binding protein [Roseiarcus fermentans]